jgi:PAS domain S-box-containing protein
MLTPQNLIRGRNAATIFIGLALLSCLAFLLIANYRSMSLLRASALDMVQHYSEKRAATLYHFFSERKDDVRVLSENIERSSFFENRAIGTSTEYGLYEGLLAMDDSFARVLERKTLGVHRVYSQIVFLESDGTPLLTRAAAPHLRSDLDGIPKSLNPADPNPQVFVWQPEGKPPEIMITIAHYHEKHYRGHILATISMETLGEHLFREASFGNGQFSYVVTNQGTDIWHSLNCPEMKELPPLRALYEFPMGRPHHFPRLTKDGVEEPCIAVRTSIASTPLDLVTVFPASQVLGETEPAQLLVVIAALSVLLCSGMFFIVRINTRNEVLQARLDESSKAKSLVEEGNHALALENAERLRTEAALRESERRYRDLTDLLPQPVFEVNGEGYVTFANHAACSAFGYMYEDIESGFHALHMIAPEDRVRASENLRRRFAGEALPSSEYTAIRKDGSRFPILIYTAPIVKDEGPAGLRGIIIDATEHKRIEQEKETTIDILRLMNSASDMEELAQSLIQHLCVSIGCDAARIRVNWDNACSIFQGHDMNGLCSITSNHSCDTIGHKSSGGNGSSPGAAHCLCDDMLHRRGLAEEHASTLNGTLYISESSIVFAEIPEDHLCRSQCPHFSTLDSYESIIIVPLRFGRKHLGSLYLCDRHPGFFRIDQVSFIERVSENIASALAQRCADQERNRLTSVVEQAAETIIITDPRGNIQYVNPAFQKVTGYLKEEVLNRNARILKSGNHNPDFYSQMWAKLLKGETWMGRLINRKKDGTLFEEEGTITPVRDESGKTINYVAVKRDVTQEVALENQLRQAQKMEALGTLAGGIAHDFNNILTAILGYSELSIGDQELAPKLRGNLEQVIKAGKRARDLVQQILAFSRQSEQAHKPVQLGAVIREVLALLRASLPATIKIHYKGDPQNGLVMADPTQIHQLLMNLCSNAAHAMKEKGGALHVDLATYKVGSRVSPMNQNLNPGSYLRLTVRDTGHGIPTAHLDRIFDPYFTTKEKGTGTGLGLAVVHGIVKSHEGAIAVESEVGKGTSFHVFLPSIQAVSDGEKRGEDIPLGGSESILLVDDEDTLVELGILMLEGMGYRVTGQTSSLEALEMFQRSPDSFDLVITDLTMPNMTGIELARSLLHIRPRLPIILCTGYSENLMPERTRAMGVREFMTKPFLVRDLARTIRKALEHE